MGLTVAAHRLDPMLESPSRWFMSDYWCADEYSSPYSPATWVSCPVDGEVANKASKYWQTYKRCLFTPDYAGLLTCCRTL